MFSEAAKNLMLDALKGTNPTTPITHVGLLQAGSALTSVTSSGDTFTKTSHGLSIGNLIAFSSLSGGSGLTAGAPYYVSAVPDANTFKVSGLSGGSAITPATNVSSATVKKYTEISGGSPAYARKSITYAAASSGTQDDSTNGITFDIPAGANVDAVAEYSALTLGTLLTFEIVTQEVYSGQGTYTVTDSKNRIDS